MSNLSVNSIFSDHMIIQHGVDAAIWGQAATGAIVNIHFAGQEIQVSAADGQWAASLPAVKAGGPYELVISSQDEMIQISDILAGEVWIAGGQSNMEWPLIFTAGGQKFVESANYDQIRSFNVQKLIFEGQVEEYPDKFSRVSAWRPANSENAGDFSAVAYHFAVDLHQRLGIPVGIIECNLGGSSASAWTSREYLARDPDVRSYLDDYDQSVSKLDMEKYTEATRQLDEMFSAVSSEFHTAEESSQPFNPGFMSPDFQAVLTLALSPGPRSAWGFPGSLYRNMLLTVAPYSARGVIFYQGESDNIKARIYGKLFKLMIENWRETFKNPDLYFLFVQLAAFGHDGNPDGDLFALVREQQALVARTVLNTGMATAIDIGSFYDIHPRRKAPVGQRLALVARAKVYGESIECSGPVYRSMSIEGGKIILEFDHADSGLVSQGETLKGFRICGANRLYHDADAFIFNNKVELSSPLVPAPAAASYGWANFIEVNLYNCDGLPAVPFKTDKYV